MLEIRVNKLNREEFAPFGEYYDVTNPQGYALEGALHRFYPDRIVGWSHARLGFSPITVKRPKEMIIDTLEYHTTTWEMILPLNADMILHVAPASAGTPVPELTKAFLVPRNTLVKIKTAIWHLAPLPAEADELQALIILPECTYANDCTVVDLKEDAFKLIN